METKFIKVGDRYLIENSNAVYVSEAEMKKIKSDEKKDSVSNANVEHKSIKPDIKQKTTSITE